VNKNRGMIQNIRFCFFILYNDQVLGIVQGMLMESDYLETILALTNCFTTYYFFLNLSGLSFMVSVGGPILSCKLYFAK
jgi:hypothetical protein